MTNNESKNEKTNEIIRIFRKYARLGLLECDLNPIQIYKKIDVLCVARRNKLDMLAVFDTLRLLELSGETEILEAIHEVYFEGRSYRLSRHEIGSRVCELASKQYCDGRTVYRRLEKARGIFESVRKREGLLLDGIYSESFNSLRK